MCFTTKKEQWSVRSDSLKSSSTSRGAAAMGGQRPSVAKTTAPRRTDSYFIPLDPHWARDNNESVDAWVTSSDEARRRRGEARSFEKQTGLELEPSDKVHLSSRNSRSLSTHSDTRQTSRGRLQSWTLGSVAGSPAWRGEGKQSSSRSFSLRKHARRGCGTNKLTPARTPKQV